MAPTTSIEEIVADTALRQVMIDMTAKSIARGFSNRDEPTVDTAAFDPVLRQKRACFVTLHRGDALRGCIGSLEATRALIVDLAHNAFAAAFRDPRFPPLTSAETLDLCVHISLLSSPLPISVTDQPDLLAQLKPSVDGLILDSGNRRATFLPSVWESLSKPDEFLRELKRKAGLPVDYWSPQMRFYRYHTASFAFAMPTLPPVDR